MGNVFESLAESIVEVTKLLPKIWDSYSNFVFKLIEGKRYKRVDKCELTINNIKKYEYVPIEGFDCKEIGSKIEYEYVEGEKEGLKVCIGISDVGEKVWFDALQGHAMVGGCSRWGKSSFLNVFTTSSILTYTENEIMFLGCDYKKSDIYYYRKYKHFRGISTNKEQFFTQINALKKEMDKRAAILDNANCRNVISYNQKNDIKLGYIIFIIDELVQLVSDKECSKLLHEIMSMSASYGCYFILASQDFTKETVGKCKMNCTQTIGFHTKDETDSTTLMGKEANLQDIKIKGRCKFDNGADTSITQIFFLEEDEIERLLMPYKKQ